MNKRRKLTPAEWEIMDAVWALASPVTVRDVLENAFPNGEKAYTTVQTVLNTLEKKRLLERKKVGMVNFYTPAHTRDEVVRTEMSSMITRVFGGSIPALATSLLSLDDLSLEEIAEIKQVLQERERKLKEETP